MDEKLYTLTLTEAEADALGRMLKEYIDAGDDEDDLNTAGHIREKLLAVRELRRYKITARGVTSLEVEARDPVEAGAKARAQLRATTGTWTVRDVEWRPA